MKKIWHDDAWEEYLNWQTQDKKTLKKINRLLKDIDRNGYECTVNPNPCLVIWQGIGVFELMKKTALFSESRMECWR